MEKDSPPQYAAAALELLAQIRAAAQADELSEQDLEELAGLAFMVRRALREIQGTEKAIP
jgi:hypothetical protein